MKKILLLCSLTIASLSSRSIEAGEIEPFWAGIIPPTPLHDAIKKGDLKMVKRLIAENPNTINTANFEFQTPLCVAARMKHRDQETMIEIMELLLSSGADIEGSIHSTPLNCALDAGSDMKIVRFLLRKGANPNGKNGHNNTTPLHHAASSYNYDSETILILVAAGADLEAKDLSDDHTPLLGAALWGDRDKIAILLALGANKYAKSNCGITPAGEALRCRNYGAALYLSLLEPDEYNLWL